VKRHVCSAPFISVITVCAARNTTMRHNQLFSIDVCLHGCLRVVPRFRYLMNIQRERRIDTLIANILVYLLLRHADGSQIYSYTNTTQLYKKILNIKQHRNNGLKSQVNRHCEQFPCVIANPSLNRSRAKTICAWRSKNCSLLVDCSQDSRRGS